MDRKTEEWRSFIAKAYSYLIDTGSSLFGVKRLGREFDYSPRSRIEVNNALVCT
jgi:hypothetical protein